MFINIKRLDDAEMKWSCKAAVRIGTKFKFFFFFFVHNKQVGVLALSICGNFICSIEFCQIIGDLKKAS